MADLLVADPALAQDLDDDSYASSGYDTSTASLTSSIQEYVYENGRRYHTYYGIEKNPLPTDEAEQDRMDLHHELMTLLLGGLHLAPIDPNPHRILDIGTGTGIWAIDMADKYASAEVIGTDLSPIQPKWVPPNCRFELDDAELDWTFEHETFDFIHARNIGQAIENWPRLMTQAYTALKPGAYIQLSEVGGELNTDDDTIKPGNKTKEWFEKLAEAMVRSGKPASMEAPVLREKLEGAGFEDIHIKVYKVPLAPWPKDPRLKRIGGMNLLLSISGYQAYGSMAFTRILGMSKDETNKLCDEALRDARNKNFHLYQRYTVAYGRKPE